MSASELTCAAAAGLLGWTWFGYPLVIWLLSRLRSEEQVTSVHTLPTVSAVLATRDDVGLIAARVADFLKADYPEKSLEVVVGSCANKSST